MRTSRTGSSEVLGSSLVAVNAFMAGLTPNECLHQENELLESLTTLLGAAVLNNSVVSLITLKVIP